MSTSPTDPFHSGLQRRTEDETSNFTSHDPGGTGGEGAGAEPAGTSPIPRPAQGNAERTEARTLCPQKASEQDKCRRNRNRADGRRCGFSDSSTYTLTHGLDAEPSHERTGRTTARFIRRREQIHHKPVNRVQRVPDVREGHTSEDKYKTKGRFYDT